MKKLSSTQTEVINRMRSGEKLHHMTGLNAKCFWDKSWNNISWATIGKLEKLDLIYRGEKFIHLTELGKTIQL